MGGFISIYLFVYKYVFISLNYPTFNITTLNSESFCALVNYQPDFASLLAAYG